MLLRRSLTPLLALGLTLCACENDSVHTVDPGLVDAGFLAADRGEPDPTPLDVGFVEADAGLPPADAGIWPDAGFPAADAEIWPDAEAPDLGIWPDAEAPDLGIWPDAETPDAGLWPDAEASDVGFPPDATPGVCPTPPRPPVCPSTVTSTTRASEPTRVVTFRAAAASQTFVVPAGVTEIAAKLWGAGGGGCGPMSGGGGFVWIPHLPVTPGESIEIVVGGAGTCKIGPNPGGFGGGGDGSDHPSYAWSGAGGGRSALRRAGTEPVSYTHLANEPATLTFAEALDGGNWDNKVPFRDRVKMLRAPFTAEPTVLFDTELRYTGMTWAPEGNRALREEYDAIRHWTRATYLNVDEPTVGARVVWDRSTDELYKHPGNVVLRALPSGFWVLDMEGEEVYMNGLGASTDGDRPFLDRLNLATGKSVRLFRSEKTAFELFVCLTKLPGAPFLTRRESPTEPPNYYLRTLGTPVAGAPAEEAAFSSSITAITHQTDPAPAVRGIQKRLVKYKRADGVDLSFTLYLPPGYKEGTRLPTVVWAYPLDYADAKMAGQVVGSTQRFTILGWPLQLFFLLDGYAVIDNPSLPVVGDTTKIYDTYLEQLIAGAEAAVKKAVELGVTDPERIRCV